MICQCTAQITSMSTYSRIYSKLRSTTTQISIGIPHFLVFSSNGQIANNMGFRLIGPNYIINFHIVRTKQE